MEGDADMRDVFCENIIIDQCEKQPFNCFSLVKKLEFKLKGVRFLIEKVSYITVYGNKFCRCHSGTTALTP